MPTRRYEIFARTSFFLQLVFCETFQLQSPSQRSRTAL